MAGRHPSAGKRLQAGTVANDATVTEPRMPGMPEWRDAGPRARFLNP
jgi:hypothetical protein